MPSIFAKPSFRASSLSNVFYEYLESLGDDTEVLLEFVSLGPDKRQIDCAILSPKGVDLIEVKNKWGKVTGRANCEWQVEYRGKVEAIYNVKRGVRENPFGQADHSARDFKEGIRWFTHKDIPVYPLVLIPQGHPQSFFERHNFVYHANGVAELPAKLRALHPKRPEQHWDRAQRRALIEHLGLSEVGLARVVGELLDQHTGEGIAGARVRFESAPATETGQEPSTLTNDRGEFSAMLPVGHMRLVIQPPEPYLSRKVPKEATQGFNKLDPIRLTSRDHSSPPNEVFGKTLEEIKVQLHQLNQRPRDSFREEFKQEVQDELQDQGDTLRLLSSEFRRLENRLEQPVEPSREDPCVRDARDLKQQLTDPRTPLDKVTGTTTQSRAQQAVEHGPVPERKVQLGSSAEPGQALHNESLTDVSSEPSRSQPFRKRSRRLGLLYVSAAFLVLAGAGTWFTAQERPEQGILAVPTERRVGQTPAAQSSFVTRLQNLFYQRSTLPGQPVLLETESQRLPEQAVLERPHAGASAISSHACPQSHPLKGNVNAQGVKIYHRPSQTYYGVTVPEACFASSEEALRAGFRASKK